MNKERILQKYLTNATHALDEDGNLFEVSRKLDADGYRLTKVDANNNIISFNFSDFATAQFDENFLVWGENRFEFKVMKDHPVPVELMDKESLDNLFEEMADDCGGSVHYGYSGRGMFGGQCYGIVTDDPDIVAEAAIAMGLTDYRQDSMGLQSIVYWPRIKYIKEKGEETEE